MKVRNLVIGLIVVVALIAVCRGLGGEALLDLIAPEK